MDYANTSFLLLVPEEIRKKILMKLRIDNSQRIYWISQLGIFFLFFLLGLDYLRFRDGKINTYNIYFWLFCNHLLFALFLIPVVVIRRNKAKVAIGRYAHQSLLIYAFTIFLGGTLVSMAMLSLIDRGDISMYVIFCILTNFGIIMLHRDRIILNSLSGTLVFITVLFLYYDQLEILSIKLMEVIGVTLTCFVVSTHIFNSYIKETLAEKLVKKKNSQIEQERQRADELLHNILPLEIAQELKSTGKVKPRHYSSATIMMIDFKDFSKISQTLTTDQLIAKLDFCFRKFDQITHKYNLEKIKTLGDGYLSIGGVPQSNLTHPFDCINAANEILQFLEEWKTEQIVQKEAYFEGRIGIHTGPVIAGVVGDKKIAFDIWGDAVNIAARVESSGEKGRINISHSTYQLVSKKINCVHRGKIPIKNQSPIDMYFVDTSDLIVR